MSADYKNAFTSLWVPIILFLIGVFLFHYQHKGKNQAETISQLNEYLNAEYNYASDFIINRDNNKKDYKSLIGQVYLFENNNLDYWSNTQKLSNSKSELTIIDTIENGVLVIPVFSILDSSLNQTISDHLQLTHNIKYASDPSTSVNKLEVGKTVIPITINSWIASETSTSFSMVFILFSFLWLLIALYAKIHNKRSLIWVIFVALGIRGIIYLLISKGNNEQLFSNANIMSVVNGSVGDFLFNVILLFFILISIKKVIHSRNLPKTITKIFAIINGFFISFGFIYFCYISKGFILHPDINLDIDAVLLFDISSIILVTTFILGNILICFYAIYSLQFLKSASKEHHPITYHLLGVIVSGFLFFFFLSFHPLVLGAFIMAYLVMIDLFIDSRNKNVVWLIWWIVIHSLFITSLVYYYGIQKDLKSKKDMLITAFQVPEYTDLKKFKDLSEQYINSDIPLMISNLPYPARLEFKDFQHFVESHLNESTPKGWTIEKLYFIDNNNSSLLRDYTTDYYSYNQKLSVAQQQSENLYFDYLNSTYFISDTINSTTNQAGPFKFGVSFKKIQSPKPHSKSNILLIKNNKFVHPSLPTFDESLLAYIINEDEDFSDKGFSFSVLNLSDKVKVVSYYPLAGLIKPMSLFSYLFTLTGIIIAILSLINTRFPFLPSPVALKVNHKTSLRNRIQSGVIVILVFSFIIIGLLTAFYFNNVLKGNSQQRENSQLAIIIEKVKAEAYFADNTASAINRIINKIDELSEYFPHTLNLYNIEGELLHSGGTPTNQELQDYRIPYRTWLQMSTDYKIISLTDSFSGVPSKTFVPLYYNDQPPFAYLSLANNVKEDSLSSIYDFLSTLLNVYVFLFLLAGAVGIIISNSITMPLSTLAIKLREFKLGQSHDPLEWDSNDEIGTLIKDYNNLILQVQESADVIAKTERDTAWREMAKQVAHEIKNPLTPMKLSLQYMQKAINTEGVDPKPLIERVSITLIEQINNLTNIANEFSNFAKMPKSNNEKVILNELVEAVHDLFRKREDMDILLSEPINELFVFADRNQLVRILNNLVKNAIQAIPTDRRGKIEISLFQRDQNAVVKVADNGIGIPENMREKVFTPNFTTKSSGTGLGLAISANIIEGFNGKIYFETELDRGTNFYVEIPLMRLSKEIKDDKRVPLD